MTQPALSGRDAKTNTGFAALLIGERVQAISQPVQLPLPGESRCFCPSWRLVMQCGKRRGFVHRRDPAVEAQLVRLILESALRECILKTAIFTQKTGRALGAHPWRTG